MKTVAFMLREDLRQFESFGDVVLSIVQSLIPLVSKVVRFYWDFTFSTCSAKQFSSDYNAVFRLTQLRAEKLALRQRKSVMRTDHWLEEQLSFTGRE